MAQEDAPGTAPTKHIPNVERRRDPRKKGDDAFFDTLFDTRGAIELWKGGYRLHFLSSLG